MIYYLDVVERLRMDSVEEALAFRDSAACAQEYEVDTFKYTQKFDKKTETEYVVVSIKKKINSEKEPVSPVKVTYQF